MLVTPLLEDYKETISIFFCIFPFLRMNFKDTSGGPYPCMYVFIFGGGVCVWVWGGGWMVSTFHSPLKAK